MSLGYTVSETARIIPLLESLAKCYEVRATYFGAKRKKGVRGAIYRYAEEHKARYSLEHSKSIYYADDSNNLEISLLFRELAEADSFAVFLGHWHFNNPIAVKSGDVSVQEGQKVVYVVESDLRKVLLVHYNASDNESPVASLEELVPSSESHASAFSLTSPVAKLQSIEHPELFSTLRPIKCHIKSKSDCRKGDSDSDNNLIDNESNLLALSRDLHDYFDGMMTIDGEAGISDIPMIAIKPPEEHDDFRDEMCGEPPLKRKRVELVVECRNEEVGVIVEKRLKMGTEKLSATEYKTHIHVADASITCACLDWKYKKTCETWNFYDEK